MRHFDRLIWTFVLALGLSATTAQAQLKVGDVAPPVTVTDWVKGKPMDVLKDNKGKVIVLEFWATWCAPCIQMIPSNTQLSQRYKDKGLVFIGVTDSGQGQQLASVQAFVGQQGDRMDYPIAFDSTQKTNMAYVVATGALGIPHAVVIGKDGKVAWFGHPLEPMMESTIKDLLMDRFDPKRAAKESELQAKLSPLLNDFNFAVQRGDWDRCLGLTEQMLTIDPGNFDAMRFNVYIMMEEQRSVEKLKAWVKQMIAKHGDNAETMAILSTLMLAMPEVTDRQPELAIEAANMVLANAAKDAESLQIVAQTFYQLGLVDGAIRAQKEAVGIADEFDRKPATEVLEFFERCKSAQTAIKFSS
ncbi:MAG: hypothetical protein DHS20C16_23950 [Phycisphaerae bacterium]|nr:MAG: hypothetical protein DHS20C16_23950 [Phycisphaerae bacterium]